MKQFYLVIFAGFLFGCHPSSEERPRMHNESAKTHCVGRHVVSIPSSFSASNIITGIFKFEGASAQDPEIDVLVQSDITTKAKFDSLVQQRRGELNRSESKTVNVLRSDKVLPSGATLFRVQEIDDAYFSEIYFLRGTAMVKIRLESYDNSYLSAEEQMIKLAAAIVERAPSGAEDNLAFCLGPVLINSNLSQEVANFTFRDNDGLVLEIDIDTFSRDDSVPLLSRISRDSSVLQDLQIRTEVLRAGERKVAGMSADEWLGVGYLGNNASERGLKFMLETKRKNPGKSTPSISLSLDSAQPLRDGTPTTTKVKDQEALHIWDEIVDSIRVANNYKV